MSISEHSFLGGRERGGSNPTLWMSFSVELVIYKITKIITKQIKISSNYLCTRSQSELETCKMLQPRTSVRYNSGICEARSWKVRLLLSRVLLHSADGQTLCAFMARPSKPHSKSCFLPVSIFLHTLCLQCVSVQCENKNIKNLICKLQR